MVDTGHHASPESEELAIRDEVLDDSHAIEVHPRSDTDDDYMANAEGGSLMSGQAASACPQTDLPSSLEPILHTTGPLPIRTDQGMDMPPITPPGPDTPNGMPFEMEQGATPSRRETLTTVPDAYTANKRLISQKIWELLEEFRQIVRTI